MKQVQPLRIQNTLKGLSVLTAALLLVVAPIVAQANEEETGIDSVENEESTFSDTAPVVKSSAPFSKSQNALTLPKGAIQLDGYLSIDVGYLTAFDTVSLAPDISYGVTDDLTLTLGHSTAANSGLYGLPGTSLCILGSTCYNDLLTFSNYPNFGVFGRYSLPVDISGIELAAEGGLMMSLPFDSFRGMRIKLGAAARTTFGKVEVTARPAIFIELLERNIYPDVIGLPATALFALNDKLRVGGETGLFVAFGNTFGGNPWSIPLIARGEYILSEKLTVHGGTGLSEFIGNTRGGIKSRFISAGASYHL